MTPAKLKIEPVISPVKLEMEQTARSGSKVALALVGLAAAFAVVGVVPAATVSFSTSWSVPLFAVGLSGSVASLIGAAVFRYFYQKPSTK